MKNTEEDKKQIDDRIFNGSLAMIALCITVISLFKVTKTGIGSVVDEILGISAFFFAISALLAYISLRNRNTIYERVADYVFFIGLLISLITLAIMFLENRSQLQ